MYIRSKKELFKTANVNFVKVPHYKELTVRKVYEMVKDQLDVMKYLPECKPAPHKPPNREFV